jgi:ABC-type lipoprotein release transport system permease subunit
MGVVTKISFRNLIRQRRRNIPMGICIALSMCILIMIFAFSSGITDILFNKLLVYAFGHIRVDMYENTNQMKYLIRDLDRFSKAARDSIPGIGDMYGEVNVFTRCLGNGKSTSLALVGLDLEEEYEEFTSQMKVLEGDPKDVFFNTEEDALFLYRQAAEKLNVKVGDIVRVKLNTVSGQVQSAQLTVRTIAEADNMFMSMAAFVRRDKLRKLLNMRKQEASGLIINMENLENPATVKEKADKLYQALQPAVAGISAEIFSGDKVQQVDLFALKTKAENEGHYSKRLSITAGDIAQFKNTENGIILSRGVAEGLHSKPGDLIEFRYKTRFEGEEKSDELAVVAVYQADKPGDQNVCFVNEEVFYNHYFADLPLNEPMFDKSLPLADDLVMQYVLLPRSNDTDSSMKKMQEVRKGDWKGAVVDIATMYETASFIIDLQYGMNMVAIVAILILFFVILIGIINTLRMTIRERTREIGTNRAIGMQQNDIIGTFVMEIFLLSVISCLVGLAVSFVLMKLFSLINFDLGDSPLAVFFYEGHLHFVPRISLILLSLSIITGLACLIAFFPSMKAAKMRVAEALRHYE